MIKRNNDFFDGRNNRRTNIQRQFGGNDMYGANSRTPYDRVPSVGAPIPNMQGGQPMGVNQPMGMPINDTMGYGQPMQNIMNQNINAMATGIDQFNVTVSTPSDFNDVKNLINNLKRRNPIIIDLSSASEEFRLRVLDFMSGATYALGGSMKNVKDNLYLMTPEGGSIHEMSPEQKKKKKKW